MEPLQVALINQTNDATVSQQLPQIADALQKQVDIDLARYWDVQAIISVPPDGADITPGTAPLAVVSSLPGRAGVHTNFQGQLSAMAVSGDQLSITLSHELLEMLVDQSDKRVIKAADLDPYSVGQKVYYLVEVCDPVVLYSYDIDGVPVSDFVLPSFYDPKAKGKVDKVDFAGVLSEPLKVPLGCYISWLDPTDFRWHEQQPDGTYLAGTKPGGDRNDRDAALGQANPDRHNVPAIYRAWPQALNAPPVYRK